VRKIVSALVSGRALAGLSQAATTAGPLQQSTKQSTPDGLIEHRIQAKFAKSKINAEHFTVSVHGGVATIEGKTNVIQHKGVATRLAKTGGAVAVNNHIQVSEAAKRRRPQGWQEGAAIRSWRGRPWWNRRNPNRPEHRSAPESYNCRHHIQGLVAGTLYLNLNSSLTSNRKPSWRISAFFPLSRWRPAGLRTLIERFQTPVYNLAYRLLNDQADASDVLQEYSSRFFRNVGTSVVDSSLRTWLLPDRGNESHNRRRWLSGIAAAKPH